MSLLRDVLRKNNARGGIEPPAELSYSSRKSLKKYAGSIRSSSGATISSLHSIAGSIASFYSAIGGTRVPKRRRSDVSRLGVPKWYRGKPPPVTDMPGTVSFDKDSFGPFTAAHSVSLSIAEGKDVPPWVSLVLHNFAVPESHMARYHNEAKVQGEVRLLLETPKNLASIDVWLIGRAASLLDPMGMPLAQFHANVWTKPKAKSTGNIAAGAYVFPFEFPRLPRDVQIELPIEDVEHGHGSAKVPLPPTTQIHVISGFKGVINYYVGVNVKYGTIGPDEELDIPFAYYPRVYPLSYTPAPFPFLPTRDDWPMHREEVGGWTLTPFGGRGRFLLDSGGNEMVEVEGILGVRSPSTYVPSQTVPFTLLLWSKSAAALHALSTPSSVDAAFMRSNTYGTDVLRPRNAARKNRQLVKLGGGRVWREGEQPPAVDEAVTAAEMGADQNHDDEGVLLPQLVAKKPVQKATPASHLRQSLTADADTESTTTTEAMDKKVGGDGRSRTPSPTPSLEDLHSDEDGQGSVVMLQGDVRVANTLPPSFRYKNMGCEYIIQLTFTHPAYSHISPSGPGIQAETPLWIVTDSHALSSPGPERILGNNGVAALPITGTVVDIGDSPVRAPRTLGEATKQMRPTVRH